jgi:hypothetical protein
MSEAEVEAAVAKIIADGNFRKWSGQVMGMASKQLEETQ